MRLVIVGSMGKAWTVAERSVVIDLIHRLIDENLTNDQREEFIVGSGESPAGGVDIWVREACEARGIPFWGFPPKFRGWAAYKERDQAMADWCTKLIRIKSVRSKTYGSGWTRDRAREQGKPTEEHTPNELAASLIGNPVACASSSEASEE